MAYPHTNLAGKQVSTKIIKNDTDMGYVDNNKYYNPSFQNYYTLNPAAILTKVLKDLI